MAKKQSELVPVFIPPLAHLLARAEELKGSPLTESEVLRIRDRAGCMTMAPERAAEMTASCGFRDVNPENCWADWQRLRIQMTGNGYLPKIVFCLAGGNDFRRKAEPILSEAGNEHEWRKREAGMTDAFKASEFRVNPSFNNDDWKRIKNHKSVLYVLSDNFTAGQAPAISQSMLKLGGRLLEAGGVAIKCESSGIGHSKERWIDLAKQVETATNPGTMWFALFSAFVQFPIQSEADFYTCGMHLLGQPDLIANSDLVTVAQAVKLFTAFALYLLAECPEGTFASGHTFSVANNAPRYRVVWEPCMGYDEDEFFFNPFGRWRFTSP